MCECVGLELKGSWGGIEGISSGSSGRLPAE